MKTPRVTIFSKAHTERKKLEAEAKAVEAFHFEYTDAITDPYAFNRGQCFKAIRSGGFMAQLYLPELNKIIDGKIIQYEQDDFIVARLEKVLLPANCAAVAYIIKKSNRAHISDTDHSEVWWYTVRDGRLMVDVVASINTPQPVLPIKDLLGGPLVTAARRSRFKCRFQSGGDFIPMDNCIYVSNAYA
jgi:hypothetical protein